MAAVKLMDVFEKLKPSRQELQIIALASIISFVARWAAFFPLAYAIDDYRTSLSTSCSDMEYLYISQGRWGLYLLNRVLELIGFDLYYYSTFGFVLSSIFLILSGVVICRIWNIKDSTPSFMVVIFTVIHPYQVEYFTFKVASLFGLPLFLSVLGLYLSTFNRIMYIIAIISICLSLSIIQTPMNYLSIVLLFYVMSAIIRKYSNCDRMDWVSAINSRDMLHSFSAVFLGSILYVIISIIIVILYNYAPEGRAEVLPLTALNMRISQLWTLLKTMFFIKEPLLPLAYKRIFSFICSARNALLFNGKKGFLSFSVIFVLFFMSLLSVVGLSLGLKVWWPVPRVLSAISLFWGGIIAFTYIQASNSSMKMIVLIPAIVLLIGAIAINNTVLTEQLKVNMRDRQKACRIIARIEARPDFEKVKKLAVIGSVWGYPSAIRTAVGDMNISAFGASWSKLAILNEVSGYNFLPPDSEEYKYAEGYCSNSPKWPHENSIVIHNDLAVLCF
jgi:hypothetical protein